MIIELMLVPFWSVVNLLITLIPSVQTLDYNFTSIYNLLGKGISVIGATQFVKIIGTIIFWFTAQFTWVVIEWIYKKIPGVE